MILGVCVYLMVEFGGILAILVVIIIQTLATIFLIFRLFARVEAMILDLTDMDEGSKEAIHESELEGSSHQLESQDEKKTSKEATHESELEGWSHQLESQDGKKKVFKVQGRTRTAKFVVTPNDIHIKSRINSMLINDDWAEEATEYLQSVVGSPNE